MGWYAVVMDAKSQVTQFTRSLIFLLQNFLRLEQ